MNLFNKTFKISFLLIVLAESLSLFGYLLPDFNEAAFFIIVFLTLILSLYKLEYGVWIVLAELFIGSKGYLFFFEHNGLIVSIRIALWLVVMAVWLGKALSGFMKKTMKRNRRAESDSEPVYGLEFLRSSYFPYFLVLFLFMIWGVANGVANGNEFNNVFFDFNGWLYFALVFPIFHIIESPQPSFAKATEGRPPFDKGGNYAVLQIFTAAIIWLSVKTFFLLFVFSHNMTSVTEEIYRWTRVNGLGEITLMKGGFYRIFFQSHIFALIGFFVFLILLSDRLINQSLFKDKKNYYLLSAVCGLLSVILITFSRSFWVGLIFGLFFCLFAFLFFYKIGRKKILKISVLLIACGAISIALVAVLVKFPYPSPIGGFSTSEILSERASKIKGEAAVSSRWALLGELWSEIKKNPLAGQGFGTTVTYLSSDPRVLERSPTGEYTTYAFEWGWLDIWLKLGLFGMLSYLLLLGKIFSDLRFKISDLRSPERQIIFALTVGLAVVAVVSVFSPYMNHPLGIGYLILVAAAMDAFKEK